MSVTDADGFNSLLLQWLNRSEAAPQRAAS